MVVLSLEPPKQETISGALNPPVDERDRIRHHPKISYHLLITGNLGTAIAAICGRAAVATENSGRFDPQDRQRVCRAHTPHPFLERKIEPFVPIRSPRCLITRSSLAKDGQGQQHYIPTGVEEAVGTINGATALAPPAASAALQTL